MLIVGARGRGCCSLGGGGGALPSSGLEEDMSLYNETLRMLLLVPRKPQCQTPDPYANTRSSLAWQVMNIEMRSIVRRGALTGNELKLLQIPPSVSAVDSSDALIEAVTATLEVDNQCMRLEYHSQLCRPANAREGPALPSPALSRVHPEFKIECGSHLQRARPKKSSGSGGEEEKSRSGEKKKCRFVHGDGKVCTSNAWAKPVNAKYLGALK